MKDHYEDYWSRPSAPPDTDPLSPARQQLLWQLCGTAGLGAGSRLIDAGCGNGTLCQTAAKRNFQSTGIDISSKAIARARSSHPDLDFIEHPLDEVPWPVPPETADVVASFEVIEHLLHPAVLLRGAHAALRGRGYLAISTPYHGRIKNLAIAMLAFDKHFAAEGDHIRFFTDHALHRLLEHEGFDVISTHHLGRAPFIWANSFIWARKV